MHSGVVQMPGFLWLSSTGLPVYSISTESDDGVIHSKPFGEAKWWNRPGLPKYSTEAIRKANMAPFLIFDKQLRCLGTPLKSGQ
jgi:hypothetical protein